EMSLGEGHLRQLVGRGWLRGGWRHPSGKERLHVRASDPVRTVGPLFSVAGDPAAAHPGATRASVLLALPFILRALQRQWRPFLGGGLEAAVASRSACSSPRRRRRAVAPGGLDPPSRRAGCSPVAQSP